MSYLLKEGLVPFFKRLIRFPSLSTEEKALSDWIERAIRETGLLSIEHLQDNVVLEAGEGSPWLFMNSHLDVVPPSPHHKGDPFDPLEKDGKIYGRGTADAKGCVAAMTWALLTLAQEGFFNTHQGKVSLALTVCEETAGYNNGMAFLRNRWPGKPDAALIGEPTSLAPCIAQKGLLILKVTTRGTAAHAARTPADQNAIYKMGALLSALSQLSFSESNPFLGTVKITPTLLSGGTAKNVSPETCTLTLDIRTIPETPTEKIMDTLRRIGKDFEIEMISHRLVPTKTDPSEKIAQGALKASGTPFFGSPTSSDWVFLADVPTVKIGPGQSELSHTQNEYLEIDQLFKAVEVYRTLIQNYLA